MANILVVDDVGIIRYKVESILSKAGFNVFLTNNINTVKNNSFSQDVDLEDIDLALLDIYLPDGNGLDLLAYLSEYYINISVIMMSVESKKPIVKKAVNLGAKEYINKPFDAKTLLNKVYSLLSDDKSGNKEKAISRQTSENDINSFKTDLSLEINRALRSENPFSLVKMEIKELDHKQLISFKETITSKIRNIDQVYLTKHSEYTFLLPLTNANGCETFIKKITEELKQNFSPEKNNILTEKITFPDIILNQQKQPLDLEKQQKYHKILLEKLAFL